MNLFPPPLETLPAGTVLPAGAGAATILPDFDFETYSAAGYVWDAAGNKWTCLPGAPQQHKGLEVVGAAAYSEHPTTEVLCLAYDLKDGAGRRQWRPGMLPPLDLFRHLRDGGLIEAWNVAFEQWIWTNVCTPRYGWPPLPAGQLRCAMAKSRAHALPGKLIEAGAILDLPDVARKDADGKRLLNKFSVPQKPSKRDPRVRHLPADEPAEAERLYDYNLRDIVAEANVSARVPDLIPSELEFWQADQAINRRGVQIDRVGVDNCIAIVQQAHEKYNRELYALTNGAVARASEVAKILTWLHGLGVHLDSLDAEAVEDALARLALPPAARRALEIRAAIGSAAVKKLFAMANQATGAGRLHDLFLYHGARTGRATGAGPQPTNVFKGGPEVYHCPACSRHFGTRHAACPWCGHFNPFQRVHEWSAAATNDVIEIIGARSLELVEYYFGDAMLAVCGCLRAMFVAGPGRALVCSDYSAIEAVVLAELAGEEWRREVFRTHGKIYEMSASKITGIPFEEYERYKKENGTHHPTRAKVGKIAELACFAGDTLVLTRRGYVPIVDVAATDQLWDGVEWVSHGGVVWRGYRQVICVDHVRMTTEHPIALDEGEWRPASQVLSSPQRLFQAMFFAQARLPATSYKGGPGVPVTLSDLDESECVYDILNAGPRNRFTIRTNVAHLIVHNSGYQGWIGAWKAFGADAHMSDDQIKAAILAWRAASPAIVEFWGGQQRNWRAELYGVEGMALSAVLNPGNEYDCRGIKFFVRDDVLYIRLLSGRLLTYHRPRVEPNTQRGGLSLSYEGWNTNPENGIPGWIRMYTWGGRLVENITQAVAADVLRFAIVNLEAIDYPVVLHVYDEIASEILDAIPPADAVATLERVMSTMPPWAAGWPIRANGGWHGARYRKG